MLLNKLVSLYLCCKTRSFKTANIKFYLEILSTEVSFCIYDRPLTGINVVAGFCAYSVWINRMGKNRLRFGKVTDKSIVSCFFLTVYISSVLQLVSF